jgi:hypothetical protein
MRTCFHTYTHTSHNFFDDHMSTAYTHTQTHTYTLTHIHQTTPSTYKWSVETTVQLQRSRMLSLRTGHSKTRARSVFGWTQITSTHSTRALRKLRRASTPCWRTSIRTSMVMVLSPIILLIFSPWRDGWCCSGLRFCTRYACTYVCTQRTSLYVCGAVRCIR